MTTFTKAYKGLPMEGFVASWYNTNTGKDQTRFLAGARAVAAMVPAGGKVLEVAPGPGFLAIELARRGFKVTGVDISKSFVKIASENAKQAGVSIDFRHGDAAHLP